MRTLLLLAVPAFLPLGALPVLAGPNGNIQIYRMDIAADGTTGSPVIPSCGVIPTSLFNGLYNKVALAIFAELAGASAAGISGAEFYISGLEASTQLPYSWMGTASFPAGTTVVGNVHDVFLDGTTVVRRGTVSWPVVDPNDVNCQTDDRILLAVIELQPPFGSQARFSYDHMVYAVGGNPPSDPQLACPVLRLCDAPVFTGVCVTGNRFTINPSDGAIGRPAEVGDPYPPDGATGVSRQVELSWRWFGGDDCTPTAWMVSIDFGTDPENLGRNWEPPSCGERRCHDPGLLAANTTYYWRASGGYATSPVWRFTTGGVIAVNEATWGQIKQLYR